MRVISKNVALLILTASLCGCSEYKQIMAPALKLKNEDSNPQRVFDSEVEPPMPSQYENDKTVFGVDVNKNGIRDDVDIWINRTGKTYNERMALRQMAKALKEVYAAGSMAYENFQKGPIDTFDEKQRDYNREVFKHVQDSAYLEAEAVMGCISFIFIKPRYSLDEKNIIIDNIKKLYNNSSLRQKVVDSYIQYSHSYRTSKDYIDKSLYCKFQVHDLDQAKLDYAKFLN